MIHSPIHKALSLFVNHEVQSLLIGGQACILYGAAEFSRDIDLAVLISPENLKCLQDVLSELEAVQTYVPSLSEEMLRKGHACHFKCKREDVKDLRIDIMGVMRGAVSFHDLWENRSEIDIPEIGHVALIGLQDLVRIKKTQRDNWKYYYQH